MTCTRRYPLISLCCTARILKQQEWKSSEWHFSFSHADMVTYLCCLTKRTSEPEPGKHTVFYMLTQCRVPECNERDVLMASHLFMRRKWRGAQSHFETVDRVKSQHWGNDCIYDFTLTDEGIKRETEWHISDSSKCSNDVMYGNILEHGGTRSYMFSL